MKRKAYIALLPLLFLSTLLSISCTKRTVVKEPVIEKAQEKKPTWYGREAEKLIIGKATVEYIGKEAKRMYKEGDLTESQLNEIKNLYVAGQAANHEFIVAVKESIGNSVNPIGDAQFEALRSTLEEARIKLYKKANEYDIVGFGKGPFGDVGFGFGGTK